MNKMHHTIRSVVVLGIFTSNGSAYHHNNNNNNNNKLPYNFINEHVVSLDNNDRSSDITTTNPDTVLTTYFEETDPSNDTTTASNCNNYNTNNNNDDSSLIMAEYYRFSDTKSSFFTKDDKEDDDESSDDEEDDDMGGDSMMLSNIFIKNRLSSVEVGVTQRISSSYSDNNNDKQAKRSYAAAIGGNSRRFLGSYNSILSMRGGGTATSIKNASSLTRTKTSTRRRRKRNIVKKEVIITRGGDSSESLKRLLVAALVTLIYEAVIGHLLEFLKIVFQTSPPGTTYLDVFKTITSEKGLAGIYDGFVPWGVIQSIGKGASFGFANSLALNFLTPYVQQGYITNQIASTIAGGIGGGFQGYILSPTLLLKTRVMTNPVFREQMSFLKTTLLSLKIGVDVVSKEGLPALMKGANVFALKRVFDWSTRYYFSEVFVNILLNILKSNSGLTVKQNALADFLGGTASTLSTLPLDVLVANIQDAKKAGVSLSPMEMILDDLKTLGWSGFIDNYTKGFIARLLHVCFTTIAMKTGTKIMYDALYGTPSS